MGGRLALEAVDGDPIDVWPTLAVRQPWAWAIAHTDKDVENRSWATRHRGPILIHAGKKVPDNTEFSDLVELLELSAGSDLDRACRLLAELDHAELAYGAIVASARLADCVAASESPMVRRAARLGAHRRPPRRALCRPARTAGHLPHRGPAQPHRPRSRGGGVMKRRRMSAADLSDILREGCVQVFVPVVQHLPAGDRVAWMRTTQREAKHLRKTLAGQIAVAPPDPLIDEPLAVRCGGGRIRRLVPWGFGE